jgi:hypothetical protein
MKKPGSVKSVKTGGNSSKDILIKNDEIQFPVESEKFKKINSLVERGTFFDQAFSEGNLHRRTTR